MCDEVWRDVTSVFEVYSLPKRGNGKGSRHAVFFESMDSKVRIGIVDAENMVELSSKQITLRHLLTQQYVDYPFGSIAFCLRKIGPGVRFDIDPWHIFDDNVPHNIEQVKFGSDWGPPVMGQNETKCLQYICNKLNVSLEEAIEETQNSKCEVSSQV